MGMTWALHDLSDNRLGGIRDRQPGANVIIERNGQRRAELTISLQDPLAEEVYPANRVLRTWLDGTPIFAGHLLQPTFNGEDQTVAIKAIDPSQRLTEAFIGQSGTTITAATDTGWALPGAPADLPWSQRAVRQGEIMARLVDYAWPTDAELATDISFHGVVRGSIATSPIRDVDYTIGKPIWEALTDWATMWGDFDLRPVNPDGTGALVALDVFARQGTDKSATVRFEYGTGRQTATAFQWEPDDNIVNRATVMGMAEVAADGTAPAQPPVYTAQDIDSQQVFGIHGDWQTLSETSDLSTLSGIANAIVGSRAFPIDRFSFTPDVQGAGQDTPRFAPDGDFWIGDTVGIVARLTPRLLVQLAGRVDRGTLTEVDAAGNVQADLTCAPQRVDVI